MKELIELKHDIACRKEEIERLRELADMIPSADPSREFVSGTPLVQCKFAAIVDQIIDLENEIAAEVEKYVEMDRQLRVYIKTIENPNHRAFLWYKYIDCLTMEKIAEKMELSVRQIYNIQRTTSFYFTDFRDIIYNRKEAQ